jgi:hypothetical protein
MTPIIHGIPKPRRLGQCRITVALLRTNFSKDSMDIILISMLPLLVPLAFLLYYALHPVNCPDCGDTLPIFYSPFKKTSRMWRAGGYLCARCGCETNMAGQKVTADTPAATFRTLRWGLTAFLLLVGVGVGVVAASLILTGPAAGPAAPVIDAPPVVAIPQQAPVAAPVN